MKKIARLLFILSWIILLLWNFSSVRKWSYQFVIWKLGLWVPGGGSVEEFIPLSSFKPSSEMVAQQTLPTKPRFETIEAHGHIFGKAPEDFDAALDRVGSRYFINLALRATTIEKYNELKKKYPSPRIFHLAGLNWEHTKTSPNFGQLMADDLEKIAKAGARGLKLWKNFGLMVRDPAGKLITLDDPRLDPVWEVCARYNLFVSIHTADPPAFFREISHHNERLEELNRRREWSFHGSEFPSFEELLAQQERLFLLRRDVTFIAVHFGERAHNLKEADRLLSENSNVYLDTAQRIDELGRQPRASRNFFNRWQDRILYGIDGLPDYEKARIYWRFLETDDEYFDYHPPHKRRKGFWKISGLGLSDTVLRKIYFSNAAKLLKIGKRGED